MARARGNSSSSNNSANIGFEAKLWLAADKLRSNMDAAEYKTVSANSSISSAPLLPAFA